MGVVAVEGAIALRRKGASMRAKDGKVKESAAIA